MFWNKYIDIRISIIIWKKYVYFFNKIKNNNNFYFNVVNCDKSLISNKRLFSLDL